MTIPSKRIMLLAIEDGNEGYAIRCLAEQLGISVEYYGIGMACDVVDLLNRKQSFDLVLLCCHGSQGGIAMPELAESLYRDQPFRGPMMPQHVRATLDLTGKKVFSTGCSTGAKEMVEAFLDAGCEWYLAPRDDPDGNAGTVFTVNFLYHHLCRGLDAAQAVAAARREDDESGLYTLFTGDDSHEPHLDGDSSDVLGP